MKPDSVKGELWNSWGLYDMIALSIINIPANFDMFLPLLGFWSAEFNAFIMPWGMPSPTLLDVVTILVLPIYGKLAHPSKLPKKVNFNYIHDRGGLLHFYHQ